MTINDGFPEQTANTDPGPPAMPPVPAPMTDMTSTVIMVTPIPLRQDEWFKSMHELMDVVHAASHNIEKLDSEGARDAAAVFQALIDAAQWLTATTSWNIQDMQRFDRVGLSSELTQKLEWRLRR